MKSYRSVFCIWGVASAVAIGPPLNAQKRNLADNLKYRVAWGDLGEVTPAPIERPRTLRIAQGGEHLLDDCLAHPEKWHRDPLIYRFGHLHALTTIGCRERASPSMHVVFYKMPDGTRQAWIHFDLHSPGDLAGHAEEVIQNRLTVGRTSQTEVFRNLIKRHGDATAEAPPLHYDLGLHARRYLMTTFGPSALASSVATGVMTSGASALMESSSQFGNGFERYSNHVEGNLVRNTIRHTIEFGAGAVLQQDESFAASVEVRFGNRARAALYHAFIVPGRDGDEFAFPRVAAALATGWIAHEWHPWRDDSPNPWTQSSLILSSYVVRSFWNEFKPDIKNRLRSKSGGIGNGMPRSSAISLSPVPASPSSTK